MPLDAREPRHPLRFPIASHRQIKHDITPRPAYRRVTAIPPDTSAIDVTWERPILQAAITLPDGSTLQALNLHLKSKLPTDIPGSIRVSFSGSRPRAGRKARSSQRSSAWARRSRRGCSSTASSTPIRTSASSCAATSTRIRRGAARSDSRRRREYRQSRAHLATHDSLRAKYPGLVAVQPVSPGTPGHADHILVSRTLLAFWQGTAAHNEILHDESVAFALDTTFPESDHAPVVAEFLLP